MIGLGLWGLCWGPRGRPARSRLYLLAATDMRPPGFMAVICGRIVAEVGRQPHVVFGVLRAADAVASHREGQDWASLCGLLAIYAVMFSAGALDIPCFIARGPDVGEAVAAGPRRAQISFGRRAAAAPLISTCR
jgi:cytochrome d ubiquinol oxidase subunit I